MKRAAWIRVALLAVTVAAALPAAAQFHDIKRAVDREIGGNQVWIPFKGLARLYVKVAHPDGVRDFQFAIYEETRGARHGKVKEIFERHLGPEWQRFVRATSRDGDEVLIYAREGDDKDTIDLMIYAGEPDETVLMMTTLDVDAFVDGLDDPGGFAAR